MPLSRPSGIRPLHVELGRRDEGPVRRRPRHDHLDCDESAEQSLWCERSESRDWCDSNDKALMADPIEPNEANDPTLPMDRIEPALPIDRIELVEPIDRIDPRDAIDHLDRSPDSTRTPSNPAPEQGHSRRRSELSGIRLLGHGWGPQPATDLADGSLACDTRGMRGPQTAAVVFGSVLVLAACTAAPPPSATTGTTMATTGPTSATTPTTTTITTTAPSAPAAPDPASIQALIDTRYDGRNLRLGRESRSTSAYRQYYATYQGDGLTISGRINIPRGEGPFPAVVLAHGYVPIEEYTNGATMLRERDYLARKGYVTLHVDYRNHADSSDDPDNVANLRNGYAIDVINAGLALQQFTSADPNRIGIVGRSMGGGVVYQALVARPGLFKAAVAYAPISSDAADNFNKWIRRNDVTAAEDVMARLGTPEANPNAWAGASPRTYFDRITDPILIHHGTADEECPIAWSEETVAALKAAGKDVTYFVYEGQRHTFTSQWPLSIQRSHEFLEKNGV